MSTKEEFEKAVLDSKNLTEKPANTTMLKLYSLYKQSLYGDNNEPEPDNPFDFVSKAKHTAWMEEKDKTQEVAMQEYIHLVSSLKE